jgi:hypothetical protein
VPVPGGQVPDQGRLRCCTSVLYGARRTGHAARSRSRKRLTGPSSSWIAAGR